MLRVIKAVVTERNMRSAEAKEDIFGVLSEIEKLGITDRSLHEQLTRSISAMSCRTELMAKYLIVIEGLVQ